MEKNMTELDTFIPQDGSVVNGKTKYQITKGDAEAANALSGQFDPFKARNLEHPVSPTETLIHLLKSCLGTGILAMPVAFRSAGLLVGIFATLIESLICTHCAYILVTCAHELYRRTGKCSMTFADIAEEACLKGPSWIQKYSTIARRSVDIGIFVTYFGTCSAYTVIVAKNIDKVAAFYGYEIPLRAIIAMLLVPLIILCYVPNLKYLTPVSMVANVFMAVGLVITVCYLCMDLPSISTRTLAANISTFPKFFSITIFALEAIGVVMPLENNMAKPQKFIGLAGVLNQGMAAVTLMYIFLGFLGYLRYGDITEDSVTLNLPPGDIAAQAVQILIALAIFCTFGLQFFICVEIAWNGLKERCKKSPLVANYVLRTVMVIVAVAIAIAVPTIGPFIGLIGAFCFSLLGLLCPIFIEIITFWEKGFGKYNWKMIKNIIVIITGVLALIFGSKSAIEDIVDVYAQNVEGTELPIMNGLLNLTTPYPIDNGTEIVNGIHEMLNGTGFQDLWNGTQDAINSAQAFLNETLLSL